MPFTGKPWEFLMQERKDLHTLAEKYGMEVVEQFIGYQGKEDFESKDYNPSFILAKDKNFIKEADVVIADFSSPSVGTDCEITIAKELFDKKVYAVVPKEKRKHMWLIFYCDYFFDTIEDAFKKIKEDFDGIQRASRIDKRQYDPIATEYRLIEKTLAQKYIYDPAVVDFLEKEAQNKAVVVLHGGSGYRARLAKHHGAGKVVGIDISNKQIQIARSEELRETLDIDYLVLDPYSLDFLDSVPQELIGNTDVVLGAFLFDHAMTYEELKRVARHVITLLKPGGKFFGMSDHPNVTMPTASKYGVVASMENNEKPVDGALRRVSIFQKVPGGELEILHFHNFLWMQSTILKALEEAGFIDIEFHIPEVTLEGIREFEPGYWNEYKQNPSILAFSSVRALSV